MLSEASSVQSPTVSIRRRTCVVCGSSTLNSYVTSFTRVPDKQEQWVTVLANGDAGFEDQLKASLATGRKYICYDHFDRQYFAQRKTDDGFELIRNRNPMAFKNATFIRHVDLRSTSSFVPDDSSEEPIPAKRLKIMSDLKGRGGELDPNSMTFLMKTIFLHVKKTMEEADEARRKHEIKEELD